MKKYHQAFLIPNLMRSILLSFIFIVLHFISNAQIYQITELSGTNEQPSNDSPGTGSVIITIQDSPASMRVQANFSGLQGSTTAAHIHATTSTPGVGIAGIATTTPTFPGFPSGVTSGTYDMTFDMNLSSSYNASFITANGGTTASAFAVLKAALNSGKAYFNIHTDQYPGGEIRGFTLPPAYQILSSLLSFNNIAGAISNAMPGDTIQQIGDAIETTPVELPIGYVFDFKSPFTFLVNLPSF